MMRTGEPVKEQIYKFDWYDLFKTHPVLRCRNDKIGSDVYFYQNKVYK